MATGQVSRRGVSYWAGDQNNPPRIIFTSGRRMVGLNANTGKLDPGFGKEGEVDITVPYDSPPVVYRNHGNGVVCDHAWNQDSTFGEPTTLPDAPLVFMPRISGLDRIRARAHLHNEAYDLF